MYEDLGSAVWTSDLIQLLREGHSEETARTNAEISALKSDRTKDAAMIQRLQQELQTEKQKNLKTSIAAVRDEKKSQCSKDVEILQLKQQLRKEKEVNRSRISTMSDQLNTFKVNRRTEAEILPLQQQLCKERSEHTAVIATMQAQVQALKEEIQKLQVKLGEEKHQHCTEIALMHAEMKTLTADHKDEVSGLREMLQLTNEELEEGKLGHQVKVNDIKENLVKSYEMMMLEEQQVHIHNLQLSADDCSAMKAKLQDIKQEKALVEVQVRKLCLELEETKTDLEKQAQISIDLRCKLYEEQTKLGESVKQNLQKNHDVPEDSINNQLDYPSTSIKPRHQSTTEDDKEYIRELEAELAETLKKVSKKIRENHLLRRELETLKTSGDRDPMDENQQQ